MSKKTIFLSSLVAITALIALTLLPIVPSWSSPADLFVTTSAPEHLSPTARTTVTLRGGGFFPTTSLWLVPERSIRSATTATLETFGNPQYLVERNDRLYVANGLGGMIIVTGLQSASPSISGIFTSTGQGLEFVLHRNEAIMAAGKNGLQIIDIRDDANPQLLAELKSVAPALSVASTGKIVYVATGPTGVQIIDLSNPRQPQHLGKIADIPKAYKVICDEEILIVATNTGGVIYDISQPTKPQRLSVLPVAGATNTFMIRNKETLYWATKTLQGSHIYSIDITHPERPRTLTRVPLRETPTGISLRDEEIAIALGSGGTELFSMIGKSRLTSLHTIAAKSRTRFALPLGSDLWVGDGGGELLRIDKKLGIALHFPPIFTNVATRIPPLVTSQLFILCDDKGIMIHARWEETTPILLAQLPISGIVQQYLSADQKHLWLSIRNDDAGKLIRLDISIPHLTKIMAEIPLSRAPLIVGEVDTTLVIATSRLDKPPVSWNPRHGKHFVDTLYFLDTTLAEAPALISSYPLANDCSGLVLADGVLALMQKNGLFRLIDLNENTPKELGSLQFPWLEVASWSTSIITTVIKEKTAFISSHLGKIDAISLEDYHQPKKIGEFKLGGPVLSLFIRDRLLFAETKGSGLTVIDIQNPPAPYLLGTIPLPGFNHTWAVEGGDGEGTLWYNLPNTNGKGLFSLPLPQQLTNPSTGDDQFSATIMQQPKPGAYCFWLANQQNRIDVPGITWIGVQE